MKARSDAFSPDEIRRILLEHQFLFTAREICAKWKIRPGTLVRWKKQFAPWRKAYTLRELVIIALFYGGGAPAEMLPFLDYRDHVVYSEDEVLTVLKTLQTEGIAVREGDTWAYNRSRLQGEWPFVF